MQISFQRLKTLFCNASAKEFDSKLATLITIGNSIMTSLQQVKDALAQAAADATAEKAAVSTKIQGLTDQVQSLGAQVTALQAQIAAGSPVTAEDLDGLLANVSDVDAKVKDILPAEQPATPAASS